MPSLRELQRDFARAIIEHDDARTTEWVRANGLSAGGRLNIYRNNVHALQTDALGAIYPVIRRLVGDDFFTACAHRHARAHPSTSGNIIDFGAAFAEFIGVYPPARDLVYLADVARLEWAIHEVFHAAAHAPFPLQKLAAVSEHLHGALRFALHPAVRIIDSPYPVLRIWQVNQDGADTSETIALGAGTDRLLVMRPQLDIEFTRLDAGALSLLQQLARHAMFESACEGALAGAPDFDVRNFFMFCIQHNVIVDFDLPSEKKPNE